MARTLSRSPKPNPGRRHRRKLQCSCLHLRLDDDEDEDEGPSDRRDASTPIANGWNVDLERGSAAPLPSSSSGGVSGTRPNTESDISSTGYISHSDFKEKEPNPPCYAPPMRERSSTPENSEILMREIPNHGLQSPILPMQCQYTMSLSAASLSPKLLTLPGSVRSVIDWSFEHPLDQCANR